MQEYYDDEHYQSFSERRFGLSTPKFFAIVAISLAFLIYLSILIFGNNSIIVLYKLNNRQEFLTDDIERLKNENASLQKKYFELQEINADVVDENESCQ
jgi:cell division protein FtsB